MGWAGAVLSVVGSVSEAGAKETAISKERQVARIESQVLSVQQRQAARRSVEEVKRIRASGGLVAGEQVAGFAGAGVDVSSGSAAELQADTARLVAIDTLTARNNAALEAWQYRTQREMLRFGLNMRTSQLRQSSFNSLLKAGATAYSSFGGGGPSSSGDASGAFKPSGGYGSFSPSGGYG